MASLPFRPDEAKTASVFFFMCAHIYVWSFKGVPTQSKSISHIFLSVDVLQMMHHRPSSGLERTKAQPVRGSFHEKTTDLRKQSSGLLAVPLGAGVLGF